MANKKKRLFKILFFPISLLICLSIFIVNTFAFSGYEIQSNGDIKSFNLWTLNQEYVLSQPDYVFYNQDLSLDSGDFTFSFEFYGSSSSAQIKFYNNEDTPVYDYVFTVVYGLNSFHFNLSNSTSKILLYSNATGIYGHFMLSSGLVNRDYFPYGYYFNNSVNQSYSIYNIFNGVEVWLQNLTSEGAILTETLSLDINQTSITFNDLPNIKSYIYAHPTYEPFTLIFYFGPTNPQSASFIITLDSYDWQPTVKLSSGFSDKVFNRSNNSNTYVVNTFNETYSSIAIIDFESSSSVVNSFRLSLVQADTSYYNNGYRDGYSNGLNDGESIGYSSGYQSGYNTGTTTNIETNGIKTLFNSILSFPVDMIKSVFNFDFMGVNISSVIMFIVSIGIVAFVLKKFL